MWLYNMQQLASCICDWLTVLRAAESLRFQRALPWGDGLWFVSWSYSGPGSLSRDIIIDGDEVRTVADADV